MVLAGQGKDHHSPNAPNLLQRGLDLPQGDVLAGQELDKILLAVDDFERPSFLDHADVTGVEPDLAVRMRWEVLSALLRHLLEVTSLADGVPAEQDLASWRVVCHQVAHVLHGLQLDLSRGQDGTHQTGAFVLRPAVHCDDLLRRRHAARLGGTVTLRYRGEDAGDELLRLGSQWRAPRADQPQLLEPQPLLHLLQQHILQAKVE
mmetsp:Transcript_52641/g.145940  ORF Transcript_52641/g.145940 Transcript_52641/m.145940 type:complete len:205 (+) Transcript_52641:378-992(+)